MKLTRYITEFNILGPVWLIFALILCVKGKVDWWVTILIISSQFKLIWKRRKEE